MTFRSQPLRLVDRDEVFALEFDLLRLYRPGDLLRQRDVTLSLGIQEVQTIFDLSRVESFLHQPHFPHLERPRHLQAGLRQRQGAEVRSVSVRGTHHESRPDFSVFPTFTAQ